MDIPEKLYHSTAVSNLNSIREYGINNAMSIDGFVYMVNEMHYAAAFAKMYRQRTCVVFEVDTSKLDHALLDVSDDHNPMFFPDDMLSMTYEGVVPPEALGRAYPFEFPDVVEFTPEQMELMARLNKRLEND